MSVAVTLHPRLVGGVTTALDPPSLDALADAETHFMYEASRVSNAPSAFVEPSTNFWYVVLAHFPVPPVGKSHESPSCDLPLHASIGGESAMAAVVHTRNATGRASASFMQASSPLRYACAKTFTRLMVK